MNFTKYLCKINILQNTIHLRLIFYFWFYVLKTIIDLMLFLNKYLNINRIKSFDLNTVKKAAESKSKVSKSDSEILPVVIVS